MAFPSFPNFRRQRFDYTNAALIGSAAALIAMPAVQVLVSYLRSNKLTKANEAMLDKQLKNTFPASDPPGSRFYGIPENRV